MAELSPEIARLSEKVLKDPTSRLFFPLAEEYVKSGLLEEAVQVLTDGLKRHPDLLSARVTLGKVYFQQGKFPEARVEFEEVLKINADNLIALRKLAAIYRHEGLLDKARQYCDTLLAANPKDQEITQLLREIESAKAHQEQLEISISSPELPVTHLSAAEQVQELVQPETAPEKPAAAPVWSIEEPPEIVEPAPTPSSSTSLAESPAPPQVEQPPAPPARRADEAPEELVSPTLAQLYLRQGHYERAVRIYDELLRREPQNETYQQAHRIAVALLQGQPPQEAPPQSAPSEPPPEPALPVDAPPAGRPHESAIRRLQAWLDHLQRQRRRRAS